MIGTAPRTLDTSKLNPFVARPATRAAILTTFESQGLTPDFVAARTNDISNRGFQVGGISPPFQVLRDPAETGHGNVLYLNSSDSFANICKIRDLVGARVLTIAGSGDFPLAFLAHGCRHIDVIDTSMPACFHAELKLLALLNFDYNDYSLMFSTHAAGFGELDLGEGEVAVRPIFCRTRYRMLRHGLSAAARTYFDLISESLPNPLFNVGIAQENKHQTFVDVPPGSSVPLSFGLLRLRFPVNHDHIRAPQALGALTVDKDMYAKAKRNSVNATYKVGLSTLGSERLDFSRYDFVYITNVGFENASHVAVDILRRGAKRVGFTCALSNVDWNGSNDPLPPRTKVRLARPLGHATMVRVSVDRKALNGFYIEYAVDKAASPLSDRDQS